MYITKDMLTQFTGKFPGEDDSYIDRYLNAAEEKVRGYLGYSPEQGEYSQTVRGEGTDILVLKAPVIEITGVSIDGTEQTGLTGWEAEKNYVRLWKNNVPQVFAKGVPYTLTYRGGLEEVPQVIVQTALQIADLFWESAGGNLAVNSTSFADSGTRVFNNFKCDRFLEQINEYRIYG